MVMMIALIRQMKQIAKKLVLLVKLSKFGSIFKLLFQGQLFHFSLKLFKIGIKLLIR